jgi:hypothetical protein
MGNYQQMKKVNLEASTTVTAHAVLMALNKLSTVDKKTGCFDSNSLFNYWSPPWLSTHASQLDPGWINTDK